MRLLLKLAWRSIWRNKRRSIITILAVIFATVLAIGMRGLQLGTYDENIQFSLNLHSGYLQIQRSGYQDNPTLQKCFTSEANLIRILDSIPEIKGYSPRVYADGLISYKQNSLGTAIFGIDPAAESETTTLRTRIREGKFFASDTSNEVVLGYKLLANLNANVGDTIVILTQGYDGSLGNMKCVISGSVRMGMYEFDAGTVIIGLRTLQNLIAMQNRINVIAISLFSLDAIPEVTEALNADLDTAFIRALTWKEVMPDFVQSIQLDNVSGMMYLAILIVVVAFGILNTVLMSVTERFREFGVMLSLGMPQKTLVAVVFFETLFIMFIGIGIGNILAYGVNSYFVHNPITFTGDYAALWEDYGWLPVMRSSLKASSFFNTTLAIVAISLLSCIYPLYKVFHLEPLKGIRYT